MPKLYLPAIMELSDYGGSFEEYQEAVYQQLLSDFVLARTSCLGKKVILIEDPRTDGREFTFCHLTSANEYGSKEEFERHSELRRLEIVIWLKPILEGVDNHLVNYYEVEVIRKNRNARAEVRLIVWYEEEGVKIVLRKGTHVLFLLTAYIITKGHKKIAENKRCQDYLQNGRRPLSL